MKFTLLLKEFVSKKRGNVAITFAMALLPVMLSIGAAIDYSRASNLHNKVAQATDAALLAAAGAVMENVDLSDIVAVNDRLNEEFEPFFLANMENVSGFRYNGYTLEYDPVSKGVIVNVDVDYETTVFGIVGVDSWEADVRAATGMQMKAGGAITMFLVLDRSGSMGWSNGAGGSKMDSLKIAVNDMISNLRISDPGEKYIRIGAVAYSSRMWSVQPSKWWLNRANDYVQAMYAGGGTNSSNAVRMAYTHLKLPSEQSKHLNRNGQVPQLVMLFMTDGDNNRSSYDVATINTCNRAKAYGIEIYTVAFQAPANGQQLLNNCASDSAHYFEPENTNELIQAFQNIGASVGEKLILSQ